MTTNSRTPLADGIMLTGLDDVDDETPSTYTDVSSWIMNYLVQPITVTQEGTVGSIAPGGELNTDVSVDVRAQFVLPVFQPDNGHQVKAGDIADIPLAEGFQPIDGGAQILQVKIQGIDTPYQLGTVEFIHDDDKNTLTAHIVFGSDTPENNEFIFNNNQWYEMVMTLSAGIKCADSSSGGSTSGTTVTILNSQYTAKTPEESVQATKEVASFENGVITWRVKVSATRSGSAISLSGYRFEDNLSILKTTIDDKEFFLEYEPGSFKVGSSNNYATASAVDNVYDSDSKTLSYSFPENSASQQFVFFQTKVPAEWLYAESNRTTTNKVDIYGTDPTKPVANDEKSYSWNNTSISKKGTPGTGTISYILDVNPAGATLTNVCVTDELDSDPSDGKNENEKLQLEKAQYRLYQNGVWSEWTDFQSGTNATASDGKYNFASLDCPAQIQITAKLKDEYSVDEKYSVSNRATISWENINNTGIGGKGATGVVGNSITTATSISKSANGYDAATNSVSWTVSLGSDAGEANNRCLVDLITYGSGLSSEETYTVEGVDGAPATLPGIITIDGNTVKTILTNIGASPALYQQYSSDKTTVSDGSELHVYTVKNADNKAVADLLVLTGENNGTLPAGATLSYKTKVTDPTKYFGAVGDANNLKNTVQLMTSGAVSKLATASQSITGTAHSKDSVPASVANALSGKSSTDFSGNELYDYATGSGVTGSATNANTFDPVSKSALFRLKVNERGVNTSGGQVVGSDGTLSNPETFYVEDSLPVGWSVSDVLTDSKYLVYKKASGETSWTATSIDAENIDVSMRTETVNNRNRNVVRFTFKTLDVSYLILLRACPSDDQLSSYIDANVQAQSITNRMRVGYGSSAFFEKDYLYAVNSGLLAKSVDTANRANGYLTWTLDYKSGGFTHTKDTISDILPAGVDLRVDANGNLVVTDNDGTVCLSINELVGSYNNGKYEYAVGDTVEVTTGVDGNITYNPDTRVLTLKIPDTAKAYRFTYVTDITRAGNIQNNASLETNHGSVAIKSAMVSLSTSDVSATMKRAGSLLINKKNGDTDAALAGAKFALYNASLDKIVYENTTGSDGSLLFAPLREGTYYLQETEAPNGFVTDLTKYEVKVVAGTTTTTTVNVNGVDQTVDAANPLVLTNNPGTTYPVEIAKVDDNAANVSGVVLGVFSSSFTGEATVANALVSWTTSGAANHKIQLVPGDYILKELQTPQGYETAADIKFTVSDTGVVTSDPANAMVDGVLTMVDKLKTEVPTSGSVTLEKMGASGALAGAEFTLYDAADQKVGSVQTTGDNGKVTFDNLPLGKYYAKETAAPAGYQFDATKKYEFAELTAAAPNDNTTFTGDNAVTNEQNTLTLVKTNDKGAALTGAKFTITGVFAGNDSQQTLDLLSDGSQGTITGKLIVGNTYTLHEAQAPENYAAVADFRIVMNADGKVTKVDGSALPDGVAIEDSADGKGSTITVKNSLASITSGEQPQGSDDTTQPVTKPVAPAKTGDNTFAIVFVLVGVAVVAAGVVGIAGLRRARRKR